MSPHSSLLTPPGFFITGTDTGVGKTLTACGFLHALCVQGKTAIGMKPVATGCAKTAEGLISDDALQLQAASTRRLPMRAVNPYAFEPPIAPHIAAEKAGERIELDRIVSAYLELAKAADAVIVEGIGGFRVPLNEKEDLADLAAKLKLPVVLVVGIRLGCLSHALLTVDAIAGRELDLAGWIANEIEPGMATFGENVAALKERIRRPCLAVVAHGAKPEAIAQSLHPGIGNL
ncbi:MAG: dethiobiotin synthase [Burkholderiales bacterium]